MRDYETSSSMPRVGACLPSVTLPWTGSNSSAADVGSAKHEHMEHRSIFGIDEAMARLPDVAHRWHLDDREAFFLRRWAEQFAWMPPRGSLGEVSLALLHDGTVVRTHGGRGRYPGLERGGELHGKASLSGTTDVIWSEPEPLDLSDPERARCPKGSVLWVGEFKSGTDAHVDPVATNLQVASNVLMTARWTGATRVVPFVLYLTGEQGNWDAPEVAWGPREIADAEKRVLGILEARRQIIERAKAGERIEGFVEGHHCTFCPSQLSCPAKIGLMRRVAGIEAEEGTPLALTDQEAEWWAARITQADAHLRKVRDMLRKKVEFTGPIHLDGGLEWGPVPGETKTIVPHVALPIIREELGADCLDDVTKISRASIEEAVRRQHAEKGIKRELGKAMGRIMAKIQEAGGIQSEPTETFKSYRPAPALPEGKE